MPPELTYPADTAVRAHQLAEMEYLATLFPKASQLFRSTAADIATPDRLWDRQRAQLYGLLTHARGTVPFHRRLLDDLDEHDPFAALRELPLLDKETVRTRLVDLCRDDLDPSTTHAARTSGTSGIPVKILYDEDHLVRLHASRMRYNAERGLDAHYKMLMPFQNWFDGWLEYTNAAIGLARVAEFGIPTRDADRERAFVGKAVTFAPDMIFGHPSSCLDLAGVLAGSRSARMTPRVVVTYGERLLPGARTMLSDTFQAPIVDTYGMREVGTIAAECPTGTYHITGERLWVEVVDADGNPVPDGDSGELVITNLTNRAMPLLRYRTGDIGALGTTRCPCGSPHKALRLLEGRDLPGIELADGRSVAVGVFTRVIRRHAVERLQIVQYGADTVEIRVSTSGGTVDLRTMAADIAAVTGPGMAVSARSVAPRDFIGSRLRKHVDAVRVAADAPVPPGPVAHA